MTTKKNQKNAEILISCFLLLPKRIERLKKKLNKYWREWDCVNHFTSHSSFFFVSLSLSLQTHTWISRSYQLHVRCYNRKMLICIWNIDNVFVCVFVSANVWVVVKVSYGVLCCHSRRHFCVQTLNGLRWFFDIFLCICNLAYIRATMCCVYMFRMTCAYSTLFHYMYVLYLAFTWCVWPTKNFKKLLKSQSESNHLIVIVGFRGFAHR